MERTQYESNEATLKTLAFPLKTLAFPFLEPTCGLILDILSAIFGWNLEPVVLSLEGE